MAEVIKEVPAEETATTTTTATVDRRDHRITVAERIVYLLGGILLGLLALRFLLRLLAANPSNGFADFVYTVTHPFVVPFFGLFNYREQFGAARFEFETLIAIAVYALAVFVLARLVALPSRRPTVE